MAPLDPELDSGASRRVVVEHGQAVKIWRHSSPLQRLRDAARARREFAILSHLCAQGLRVPRPRELRRGARGHELAMQLVPGAVNVQLALEGRAAWPLGRARAWRELGALLADLHGVGLRQRDLHPGNALLDPQGRAWAVDFDKARLAAAPTRARLRRELVELCAYAVERTTARERARFALAWWRALPAALRAQTAARRAELGSFLAEVERAAPACRDQQVRRLLRRWLRESSRVRRVQTSEGRLLVAREPWPPTPPDAPTALARERGWRIEPYATRRAARARWLALAENAERDRPGPRPALFWLAGPPRLAST
jgi:tRNA A-37 threonylcarbamoyl transferase component Bud32